MAKLTLIHPALLCSLLFVMLRKGGGQVMAAAIRLPTIALWLMAAAIRLPTIALWLIRFYQQHLSMLLIPSCRYYPSCSRYFLEAVEVYGILPGSWKGFLRIIRCNPLFLGGYDPIDK